jgi:GDP-D-mannose 3',5'-epimerase
MDANVITASLDTKVKKFIFASTACIYPVSKQLQWNSVLHEDDALNPVEPESGYGWVKLTTEIGLNKIKSMDIGILRLFNVYGEGEDYSAGSHVIPELCRKIIMYPKQEVVVFGNGEQGRCFLYTDDAVEGYMLCMEKGCINEPINLGHPNPIRIRELVGLLKRISGKDFIPQFDMDKPTGVIGRVPSIEKAQKILGWYPNTTLDQGLPKVYKWMEDQIASEN